MKPININYLYLDCIQKLHVLRNNFYLFHHMGDNTFHCMLKLFHNHIFLDIQRFRYHKLQFACSQNIHKFGPILLHLKFHKYQFIQQLLAGSICAGAPKWGGGISQKKAGGQNIGAGFRKSILICTNWIQYKN